MKFEEVWLRGLRPASVSLLPQEGFLHHRELDTLGLDQPESKCKLQ